MKARNLKAEATAARQLLDVMRDEGLLPDEGDAQIVVESETLLVEMASAALRRLDELTADANALRSLIGQYQERRRLLGARADRLRDRLRDALAIAALGEPLRLPQASLSLATQPARPQVIDEAEIPREFLRFKSEPDMLAIAGAFGKGRPVPGCRLSNGGMSLVVRRD